MHGGEECLLCKVEGVPANWKPVQNQYGVINFTKIVVLYRKAEDGGIGVDTVEKEKILRDARNMFIFAIYSVQVRLRRDNY